MAADPRRASVPHHITALARRSDADAHRLISVLAAGCWPRGSDGHRPAAAAWLARWRPARGAAPLPSCDCAGGHCAVCN